MLELFSRLYTNSKPSDKSIVDLLTSRDMPAMIETEDAEPLAINYGPIIRSILPTIDEGNSHYVIDSATKRLLHTIGSGRPMWCAADFIRRQHEAGDPCIYLWKGDLSDFLDHFGDYIFADANLVEPIPQKLL
ncbi:hypothetical protein H6503_03530 [Candidatus Woesearchaeota archaeon]|nr:hypothetical protein [Candidatus Woesearchaeota archaeon]